MSGVGGGPEGTSHEDSDADPDQIVSVLSDPTLETREDVAQYRAAARQFVRLADTDREAVAERVEPLVVAIDQVMDAEESWATASHTDELRGGALDRAKQDLVSGVQSVAGVKSVRSTLVPAVVDWLLSEHTSRYDVGIAIAERLLVDGPALAPDSIAAIAEALADPRSKPEGFLTEVSMFLEVTQVAVRDVLVDRPIGPKPFEGARHGRRDIVRTRLIEAATSLLTESDDIDAMIHALRTLSHLSLQDVAVRSRVATVLDTVEQHPELLATDPALVTDVVSLVLPAHNHTEFPFTGPYEDIETVVDAIDVLTSIAKRQPDAASPHADRISQFGTRSPHLIVDHVGMLVEFFDAVDQLHEMRDILRTLTYDEDSLPTRTAAIGELLGPNADPEVAGYAVTALSDVARDHPSVVGPQTERLVRTFQVIDEPSVLTDALATVGLIAEDQPDRVAPHIDVAVNCADPDSSFDLRWLVTSLCATVATERPDVIEPYVENIVAILASSEEASVGFEAVKMLGRVAERSPELLVPHEAVIRDAIERIGAQDDDLSGDAYETFEHARNALETAFERGDGPDDTAGEQLIDRLGAESGDTSDEYSVEACVAVVAATKDCPGEAISHEEHRLTPRVALETLAHVSRDRPAAVAPHASVVAAVLEDPIDPELVVPALATFDALAQADVSTVCDYVSEIGHILEETDRRDVLLNASLVLREVANEDPAAVATQSDQIAGCLGRLDGGDTFEQILTILYMLATERANWLQPHVESIAGALENCLGPDQRHLALTTLVIIADQHTEAVSPHVEDVARAARPFHDDRVALTMFGLVQQVPERWHTVARNHPALALDLVSALVPERLSKVPVSELLEHAAKAVKRDPQSGKQHVETIATLIAETEDRKAIEVGVAALTLVGQEYPTAITPHLDPVVGTLAESVRADDDSLVTVGLVTLAFAANEDPVAVVPHADRVAALLDSVAPLDENAQKSAVAVLAAAAFVRPATVEPHVDLVVDTVAMADDPETVAVGIGAILDVAGTSPDVVDANVEALADAIACLGRPELTIGALTVTHWYRPKLKRPVLDILTTILDRRDGIPRTVTEHDSQDTTEVAVECSDITHQHAIEAAVRRVLDGQETPQETAKGLDLLGRIGSTVPQSESVDDEDLKEVLGREPVFGSPD